MRQQFQLHQHPAKINAMTPRAEFAGDQRRPASSLNITVGGHSSLLNMFNPKLRPLLFRKGEQPGDQDDAFAEDNLTELAMPNLKPLQIDEDFPGYRMEISAGLDFSKPIVLVDAELSNWKFVPKPGGSVEISLSVAAHPDEETAGKLAHMVQSTPFITLIPPAAEEHPQQQMDLGGEGDTLTQQEAQDARDAFAAAAAQADE